MSKINDMIKELCPNGVEYKKLGEICEIKRGKRLTKSLLKESGTYPVYHGGLDPLGYFDSKNRDGDTVMIINVGASAGTVGYSNEDFWSSDGCFCLSKNENILSKYLYYFLKANEKSLVARVRKAGIPTLDSKPVEKIEIPVPPIEIQQEIVRILDNFTNLTSELQAELQARKEQYEYYRNKLLTFTPPHYERGKSLISNELRDNSVKWMKMGDIGTFIRGNGLQKKDFVDTGIGCIHYGQIYTHYGTSATKTLTYVTEEFSKKLRKAQYGDLVIATTSENVEDVCKAVAWLGKEEIAVSSDAYIYHHNQNPKYISYLFQTDMFFNFKRKVVTGTKVMRVSGDSMAKFEIPIPPLSEQERIVSILDKFEALVNDLTSGLPAEIAVLQEQYEYYRNKLLTFERSA